MLSWLVLELGEKNADKAILCVCGKNLCSTVHFKIPEVFAVCVKKEFTIQIPIEVHTFYRKLNGFFIIFFAYAFYFYAQYDTSSNSGFSVSLLYHTFVNKSSRKPCIDTRRLVIPALCSLHPQLVAVYHQTVGLDRRSQARYSVASLLTSSRR